ncbi:helix-turn-helix transcriptional regulator [Acinetobacter sp. MD2]|uniref:AraC family transcriptional regulator n=1 Tax=Acinetobacter sp. MD2 TaxID=2600066 RepID=UPI002D1E78CB|nr:helix-turn-helix transcriptional regulator [Acinetobacter sp. MD2]MEB3766854.1 helix-turn-helix domain-containing protein [Acinetobacter sp. MD2]
MQINHFSSTFDSISNAIEVYEFLFQPDDSIASHACLWGDFNFSLDGMLQLQVGDKQFFAPPNYGLWLPPHTAHSCLAIDQHDTHFICIRIHPLLCQQLYTQPKTLSISPFFQSLMHEVLTHKSHKDLAYDHLLHVVFDQLKTAQSYDHYLPQTMHPDLQMILQQLRQPERFKESTSQILAAFALSERQILRLSQQELQLPISEWRNRAKIIEAIAQLQQGNPIKSIAYQLGYRHSSSFIEFFKRYTGQTPQKLRQSV